MSTPEESNERYQAFMQQWREAGLPESPLGIGKLWAYIQHLKGEPIESIFARVRGEHSKEEQLGFRFTPLGEGTRQQEPAPEPAPEPEPVVEPERESEPVPAVKPVHASVLGRDIETGKLVLLPEASRDQMLYVIGKTGMGKSTLLLRLILDNIQQGRGVCVFDPHGQLIEDVVQRMDPKRLPDLWLADAGDKDYTIGVNLFACSDVSDPIAVTAAADGVVSAFKKVWGVGEDASWGPALEDLLRMIAYTLIHNPGHYLTDVPRLLYDEPNSKAPNLFRQQLVGKVPIQVVKDYWRYDYDPLNDRDQRMARSSTMNKVRAFLSSPILSQIVGGETTLDFARILSENQICLVTLPWKQIGEEAVSLLGSVLVNQFLLATGKRTHREPFFLYADEYQRFATPAFGSLIDEARKAGICTTVAHQRRDQLEYRERNVPLGAANLIVFGVTGEDADVLATNFTIPREPGEKQVRLKTYEVNGVRLPSKHVTHWPEYHIPEGERVGVVVPGEMEHTYEEVPGPPRPMNDVRAELANKLATMPPYQAKVRLRIGRDFSEHLVAIGRE